MWIMFDRQVHQWSPRDRAHPPGTAKKTDLRTHRDSYGRIQWTANEKQGKFLCLVPSEGA